MSGQYDPTHEQRKAIEAYVRGALSPLIESVLTKQLGMAAVFLRDKLAEPTDKITLPLADAQMLLTWMDEIFGNDEGTDWHDEDAGAVGDALNKAIENFKVMRSAVATRRADIAARLPDPEDERD